MEKKFSIKRQLIDEDIEQFQQQLLSQSTNFKLKLSPLQKTKHHLFQNFHQSKTTRKVKSTSNESLSNKEQNIDKKMPKIHNLQINKNQDFSSGKKLGFSSTIKKIIIENNKGTTIRYNNRKKSIDVKPTQTIQLKQIIKHLKKSIDHSTSKQAKNKIFPPKKNKSEIKKEGKPKQNKFVRLPAKINFNTMQTYEHTMRTRRTIIKEKILNKAIEQKEIQCSPWPYNEQEDLEN